MKKLLFGLIMFLGFSFQDSYGQVTPVRTREAIFFIDDLSSFDDVQKLENYLYNFEGKVHMVTIDLTTQMCVLQVAVLLNEDIEQIIFQAGYKGYLKLELPPSGFKYIHNPDGTWKLKEI